MTPEQKKERSAEKVNQIRSLLKALNITIEAVDIIDQNMVIRKTVTFTDNEIYPNPPAPVAPVAPVEEVIPESNDKKSL